METPFWLRRGSITTQGIRIAPGYVVYAEDGRNSAPLALFALKRQKIERQLIILKCLVADLFYFFLGKLSTAAGRQNLDYWALPTYIQILSHGLLFSTSPDVHSMERQQNSTGAPSTPRVDNAYNLPSGSVAMSASQSNRRKTNNPRSGARRDSAASQSDPRSENKIIPR